MGTFSGFLVFVGAVDPVLYPFNVARTTDRKQDRSLSSLFIYRAFRFSVFRYNNQADYVQPGFLFALYQNVSDSATYLFLCDFFETVIDFSYQLVIL